MKCYRSSMLPKRIEECRKCGKPFVVSGGHTGPMIDSEDINCPHCGGLWGSDRIADVFTTRKLTSAEEAEYTRSKKS
jgi:DNA-directed RNA polymerase subunit RPC12/RpoP